MFFILRNICTNSTDEIIRMDIGFGNIPIQFNTNHVTYGSMYSSETGHNLVFMPIRQEYIEYMS